ncbi:MAG: MotA/TolQ/ExbB proton channel family protein [Candidatus Nitrotoga sp.]|nr:MotA/TolQ/ExbB proton channel family protein [Candidatus Nitrotoga sp.]MBA0903020.1 MotA/TolQ/ExbB proton channel family protein [Candidatus Nitrotoga sp.]MBP0117682.1 MotA/TolQ/ExbB proton channel family protein [Candidatus Nitrotoga sp.]MBP0118169.1 MotA/TolQ/ExbB proton channel family protein [Candidatus Nitrotoga sp.]MBP0122827.1 MotA/TolQ/ExbB proton channel family protein [Candidatus Nitrotoga sp.]
MFGIVEAAGWPIWFLIIASVIAVALIVERLIALRSQRVSPLGLLDDLKIEIRHHGVNDAMLHRLEAGSPLGRVLAAGLKSTKGSSSVMKASIEEEGRVVSHELERFLAALGTIASISPLLGLFGTIVGMIEIFGVQNSIENSSAALAHGISIALYNTAFGLMVAIPSMIFYRYFRTRVDTLVIEMEQQAIKLIKVVHDVHRD